MVYYWKYRCSVCGTMHRWTTEDEYVEHIERLCHDSNVVPEEDDYP